MQRKANCMKYSEGERDKSKKMGEESSRWRRDGCKIGGKGNPVV